MPTTTAARMKPLIRNFFILAGVLTLAACGGGGGDNGGGGSVPTVTISGKITFDRVPFKATVGSGLDFSGIVESPARQVVVEAVQPGNVLGGETILASTVTDTAGDYSLQVPSNRNVLIRAKAQMLKAGTAPTWNFQVLNNTNSDALYTLDGITSSSGNSNSTRNLRATSGWGAVSYTGPRAAAPFAILDTIYKVKDAVLSVNASTAFPALDLYWSVDNRPSNALCPDSGDIVSSLYVVYGTDETDECSTPTPGRNGIYILGNFQLGDTDEFDQHVIAHEAGHYFEDKFSRSDSIGGSHGNGDRLDLRVAFGEGWGNAFGAMVLNDPQYRDSDQGAGRDTGFSIESSTVTNPGWFSEFSVHKFLWDIFDPANEPSDTVALGFAPVYNIMLNSQPGTDALTSLFPFVRALKASNAASSSGINTLLAEHGISAIADDFGSTEPFQANITPIYTPITLGNPVNSLCGIKETNVSEYNKLSNRRFLRFDAPSAGAIDIVVTATSGTDPDPDVIVWRRGDIVDFGDGIGTTESLLQVPVQVGTYVIEIYDYNHVDMDNATGSATTCMSVSIAG